MSDYHRRSPPRGSARPRSRSRSPRARRRSRSRSSEDRHHRHRDDERQRRRSVSPPRPRSSYLTSRREELYVYKHVALDQYKADYMANKYANLTQQSKMHMFGSRTMPIFVPLARGESREQYETRFLHWLGRLRLTLAQVRDSKDVYKERELRIQFANANATGWEKFETFDWSQAQDLEMTREPLKDKGTPSTSNGDNETPAAPQIQSDEATDSKTLDVTARIVGARDHCPSKHPVLLMEQPADAVVEAHLACGCTPCLFAVMDRMAQHLDAIQAAQSTAHEVVDLTHDDEGVQSVTRPSIQQTIAAEKEPSVM